MSPGLPIWMDVKIPFPKLGFYGWLASSVVNQGGLRLSTEIRQNHSQKKLEWVYFSILLTDTDPVCAYIHL